MSAPLLSPSAVLQEVGTCLYGPHFLTPLSLSLHCPRNSHPGVNYDNLRAWVKGTRTIPSWVWGELHRLIQERREEMRGLEGEVRRVRREGGDWESYASLPLLTQGME